MLCIISTPIGNLKDITLRAIDTLKTCDLVLAEDTRKSAILFKAHAIQTPMISFHQFNEKQRERSVLNHLQAGKQIGLISDAGTPGICDPGTQLIKQCQRLNIPVDVIPGPCAMVTALSAYGVEGRFQFIGFLDKKVGVRNKQLIDMLYYDGTSAAYVSPHQLLNVLQCLPERGIFLGRELTKMHQDMLHGTPQFLLNHFQDKKVLGECVLVIPGQAPSWDMEPKQLVSHLQETYDLTVKDATLIAAKLLNTPKRALYDTLHRSCS